MNERVSVVGLGKLGLCLAACFAKKGIDTIGIDIEENLVNSINNGASPINEPGLDEIISEVGGKKLKATLDYQEAIDNTDITFILVATPSNPDGSFSNRYVESALRQLSTIFGNSKKKYHTFVISSTVVPGSTDQSFIPMIEKLSGKKLNVDFGVCYDPDFVALGEVIKGFFEPELIIIGESSKTVGDKVETIHKLVCNNEPHIARMSIITAEVAKVCLNCYLTVKISFANTIANICENIPGANVDQITNAIGVDKRISPYFLKGGLSFGGTCFPRDLQAFVTIAEQYQNSAELIKAVQKVNEYQNIHLLEVVTKYISLLKTKDIGILGLSFKPKTSVLTESPAIKLIQKLLEQNVNIMVYDPLAIENTKVLFNDAIEYVSSARECVTQSSLCVIANPETEYKLTIENYKPKQPLTIIDCWRILDPTLLDEQVKYIAIGCAENREHFGKDNLI